jgi:N,N'-diacetyllegionaminate synthase
MARTFVIAEVGSAWVWEEFNSTTLARGIEAIKIAARCGADMLKMQWTSSSARMATRRNVDNQLAYTALEWPKEWMSIFKDESAANGIEFGATCYLPEDVAILNPYVKRWKIASLEADAMDLRLAMGKTAKQIIASTGAGSYLCSTDRYSMLHCTAAYPVPLNELNLKAIENCHGYSDHSCDILTGALAVACGAEIIEVHFMLPDTPKDNPDHGHSLRMTQLREYIQHIRKAEVMLGDGIKRVMPSEEWALKHKVRT